MAGRDPTAGPNEAVQPDGSASAEPISAEDADGSLPCSAAENQLFGATPLAPLDPRDEAAITLMGLLVEVHARLTRVLGGEMEDACGLPLTWYDAMIRLRRAPGGFTTMTRLATEVSLTSGGITRLVDRLVEAGYAERRNCPTDRRSVWVSLTTDGVAKVDEATAAHRAGLEEHLLAPLDDGDRVALEAALRRLRNA